jgi:predicted ester cyclase
MIGAVSTDRNRAAVNRFFRDVVGRGDIDLLDEIAVADYEDHVALPGQAAGRDGLKRRIEVIRAAFTPRQVLHDVIVDGDLVAVRWTLSGVHSGQFLGIAATNRKIEFDGIDLYRMRGGRMAAHWNVVDMLAFYRQATGTNTIREADDV